MVNGEQYGELISPQDEPSVQLNLPHGQYECYVAVIPKDKDQEVYESNILVGNQYLKLFFRSKLILNSNSIFHLLMTTISQIKIKRKSRLVLLMYTIRSSLLKRMSNRLL